MNSTALIQKRHALLNQMTDTLNQSAKALAKGDETRAAELDADRADETDLDDLEVDQHLRRLLVGALLSLDNGQRPRAVARRVADAVRRYR